MAMPTPTSAIKRRLRAVFITLAGVFGTGVASAAATGLPANKAAIPSFIVAVLTAGLVAVIHYVETNATLGDVEAAGAKASGLPAPVLNRLLSWILADSENVFGKNATIEAALKYVTGQAVALPTATGDVTASVLLASAEQLAGRDRVTNLALKYVSSNVLAPSPAKVDPPPAPEADAAAGLPIPTRATDAPAAGADVDPVDAPPVTSVAPATA